jgi:hypothetical protein
MTLSLMKSSFATSLAPNPRRKIPSCDLTNRCGLSFDKSGDGQWFLISEQKKFPFFIFKSYKSIGRKSLQDLHIGSHLDMGGSTILGTLVLPLFGFFFFHFTISNDGGYSRITRGYLLGG